MKWILGTRGSRLAIAQSTQVKELLEAAYEDLCVELKVIKTTGDKQADVALDKLNDKGVFVKEIEEALLLGDIDLAVHSMKDMPSQLDDRLCFTKTLLREDARDVLILRNASSLDELPPQAKIATGSARRALQLLHLRSDIKICGIRGNIETRIQKMEGEGLDGIVLAAAGLHRLHLQEHITCYFDEAEMVPACGQGALAIEVRKNDTMIKERMDALSDPLLDEEVKIERALLKAVDAGCHTPFAVRAHIHAQEVVVLVMYGREDTLQYAHFIKRYPRNEVLNNIGELANELKRHVKEAEL